MNNHSVTIKIDTDTLQIFKRIIVGLGLGLLTFVTAHL